MIRKLIAIVLLFVFVNTFAKSAPNLDYVIVPVEEGAVCNSDNKTVCAELVYDGLKTFYGRTPTHREWLAIIYFSEFGNVNNLPAVVDYAVEVTARHYYDRQTGLYHCVDDTCVFEYLDDYGTIINSVVMHTGDSARVNIVRLLGGLRYEEFLLIADYIIYQAPEEWQTGLGYDVPSIGATVIATDEVIDMLDNNPEVFSYTVFDIDDCEYVFFFSSLEFRASKDMMHLCGI